MVTSRNSARKYHTQPKTRQAHDVRAHPRTPSHGRGAPVLAHNRWTHIGRTHVPSPTTGQARTATHQRRRWGMPTGAAVPIADCAQQATYALHLGSGAHARPPGNRCAASAIAAANASAVHLQPSAQRSRAASALSRLPRGLPPTAPSSSTQPRSMVASRLVCVTGPARRSRPVAPRSHTCRWCYPRPPHPLVRYWRQPHGT